MDHPCLTCFTAKKAMTDSGDQSKVDIACRLYNTGDEDVTIVVVEPPKSQTDKIKASKLLGGFMNMTSPGGNLRAVPNMDQQKLMRKRTSAHQNV
jgi:hypothetical protein